MMASCFFLAVLQCVMLTDSTRIMNIVNRSYGPAMCREMCQNYDDIFSFMKEYHCRYISTDSRKRESLSTEDSFTCLVKRKITNGNSIWSVITGGTICNTDTRGAKPTRKLQVLHNNLNVTLHQACEEGDLCMVKYILTQKHADINSRGKYGRTPVMAAAGKAQVDIFHFLVSRGCDLSVVDAKNYTVLHIASEGGSIDIVRTLLVNQGFGVDSRGWEGWTAAMFAAHSGQKDVFDFLVGNGCNLAVVSIEKQNILHVACMGGHVDIVKFILSKGISIESRGFAERTPVMMAAQKDKKEVFDLLVEKGCNLGAIDKSSYNILHIACESGHVNMVKHILSKHFVPLDSRTLFWKTPVMMAVEQGHTKVVDILVGEGCNLEAVDNNKDNVLHLACGHRNLDMIKYILSKNIIGLESRGFEGRTPVMMAAESGIKEVFDLLVDKGCNISAKDNDLNSILHIACIGGHVNMVKHILSKHIIPLESREYSGQTPLMVAADYGHRNVFDILVREGCNQNALTYKHNNLLHVACYGGHVDMVKYILSKQLPRLNIESRGFDGRTSVMFAAEFGNTQVVSLLVRKGCNLKVVDYKGNNVLHIVCFGGNIDMVRYITELDIVLGKQKNKNGETPMQVAETEGHASIVHLLKVKLHTTVQN